MNRFLVERRLGRLHAQFETLWAERDAAGVASVASEALATAERALGDSDVGTAVAATDAARAAALYGDVASALRLLDRAWSIWDAAHDVAAVADLTPHYLLAGQASEGVGDDDAAEQLYERAIDAAAARGGQDGPEAIRASWWLAELYRRHERFDEAQRLFERAAAATRRHFGADSPDYAATLSNLGVLLSSKGDSDAAERAFADSLEAFRAGGLRDDPRPARAAAYLAVLYTRTGRFREARERFEEALPELAQTGAPVEEVGRHTLALAHCLEHLGARQAAHARYEEAIAALAPGSPEVAEAQEGLDRTGAGGSAPADEREAILLWAMRELGERCTAARAGGDEGPYVGAAVVLAPGPGVAVAAGALPIDTRVAEGNDTEKLEAWLAERVSTAFAAEGAVMAGLARTIELQYAALERTQAVWFRFEDATGTFFEGIAPFDVADGNVQWAKVLFSEGFDRASRAWPPTVPEELPNAHETAALLEEAKSAAADITRYERTGATLRALDSAVGTLERLLREYRWDGPPLARLSLQLSRGLLRRYQRIGDPSDLSRATDGLREVIASGEDGDVVARAHLLLVVARTAEHHGTGQPEPLDDAIAVGEERLRAIGGTAVADPELGVALAAALLDRGQRYSRPADVVRAQEIIVDQLRTITWEDVDWAAPAFDCIRRLIALNEADPERGLRAARMAATLSEPGERIGDESYRYIAAFAQELVAAYRRRGEADDLRTALKHAGDALDVESPEPTAPGRAISRLTWSSPYRTTLLEAWAEALEAARDSGQADLVRVDPDGTRMLRAREELVALAPSDSPAKALACDRLADARVAAGDLAGARDALRDGVQAWEGSFATSATVHRFGIASLGAWLHQRLFAALLAGDENERAPDRLWEALAVAEGAKSRVLTEAIGRGDLPAPAGLPLELVERERDLVGRLKAIDDHDLAALDDAARVPDAAAASRRAALVRDLHEAWTAIEEAGPEMAEYVALRRGRPLDAERLRELIGELPTGAGVLSLMLDGEATFWMLASAGTEKPQIIRVHGLSLDEWQTIVARMWREIPRSRGRDRGATWLDRWSEVLDLLARLTIEQGIDRLVVSPLSVTHALPWAALAQELERRRERALSVVVEPALATLDVLRARRRDATVRAAVVGDPLGDLRWSAEEAEAVSARLGVAALIGPHAARDTVEAIVPGSRNVHLATHARFDAEDPLGSAIILADGAWTAREVIGTTLSAELVVLSSCESGRVEPLSGGEVAGLGMAILHAGARRAIVTLWPVDDRASGVFMDRLYAALDCELDHAAALREAARALRSEPEHAHPYFWAGYVLLGDL